MITSESSLEPEQAWAPFSEESLWHACPGHDWERFEWGDSLVTRCEVCGAARCDSYQRPPDLTAQLWDEMSDHDRQLYRCTEERHHENDHDFLVDVPEVVEE